MKPVVLCILDGMGIREEVYGNAVAQANKVNFDMLEDKYPHTLLHADGGYVGLPDGQMGNSEVGHLNIGAGRVVYQSLVLLNNAIADQSFFANEHLMHAMTNAKDHNLHILGLLSDGGVHAHINHILALLEMAKKEEVNNVFVHIITDGRDVGPQTCLTYIKQLQDKIDELGVGCIASISGRYYAMDRDKRWDRVELAYNAIVEASGNSFDNVIDYVNASYEEGVFDEFIKPAFNKNIAQPIKDNDSVVFANFRPDRAIQLSGVLTNPNYDPKPESPVFKPNYRPTNLVFVGMMKYHDDVNGEIAFALPKLNNGLGEVVSKAGLNQLRIAETEKYPHVTFFFDGGEEKEYPGCKRLLIDSPKVATYDLKPEMSAYEVCSNLINELKTNTPDVVILNFANPDMVGHSGKLEPTIKAIEAVDDCLGQIYQVVDNLGGVMLITADHGNSDKVLNEDGSPNTAHTTSLVPLIVTKEGVELKEDGRLCDLAPTMLDLLGVEQPSEMTGHSLIK